ncbi:MAG: hypothetical protein QNI86_05715 [Halieaceae bacterium]|nr:hypothetical protein [Halieaceae bacterium]
MKTMLMTWLTTGTFLGAVVGLIIYIFTRDAATATLAGVFGGFIGGAGAAALSGYIDQRVRENSEEEQDSQPGS